jgi:hypothetical protein
MRIKAHGEQARKHGFAKIAEPRMDFSNPFLLLTAAVLALLMALVALATASIAATAVSCAAGPAPCSSACAGWRRSP